MKKIFNLVLTVGAIFFASSCDNYLDVNQNPNNALYSDLTPPELLAAAQVTTYQTQAQYPNLIGERMVNAWNESLVYGPSIFQNPEYSMNLSSSFLPQTWDNYYVNINNLSKIENYPNENHKYDNYVAIAKILKVFYMQYVVDLYGDCPYSEAFKGKGNTTPKYDNDEDIYKGLVNDIELAWTMINAVQTNTNIKALVPDASTDVIYKGTMTDWQKFALTVELKLLVRMSNASGTMGNFRDAHLPFINGAGKDFVTDDVLIDPGYTTASAQQNPFYNLVGSNPGYVIPTGHAYKCLSNDYAGSRVIDPNSSLPTLNYPDVVDYRRTRLFAPSAPATTLCAITQGSGAIADVFAIGTPSTKQTASKLGQGIIFPNNGSTAGNVAKGTIMSGAESLLLQSEAKVRGYLSGGISDAGNDFKNAIKKSYGVLKVTATSNTTPPTPANPADVYISNIDPIAYFGWAGSTTTDQRIAAIMYQKWVALMGFNGIESYIEYNRTGFPILPLSLTCTSHSRRPYRLLYPNSELSYNSSNVPTVTIDDIFNINSPSLPFWVKH